MVVCPRTVEHSIASFIQLVYLSPFHPVSLAANQGQVREQLSEALSDYISLHSEGAFRLIEDMVMLTDLFMKLTHRSQTQLLLQTVENDACRKFHVDLYPIRLICTYDGPGTQWLPNHQVNRKALQTTNEQIAKDPYNIQNMGSFHVGIMKGNQTNYGIVHRSPPIKEQGLKRSIFRLD
ncbi:DUF1826 domain-containing protein [Tunicatimonas pelagia]|nr:DUF1826 domain-containing protein [Tunicatimonas pelagia]